jgi:hypothetical protein
LLHSDLYKIKQSYQVPKVTSTDVYFESSSILDNEDFIYEALKCGQNILSKYETEYIIFPKLLIEYNSNNNNNSPFALKQRLHHIKFPPNLIEDYNALNIELLSYPLFKNFYSGTGYKFGKIIIY